MGTTIKNRGEAVFGDATILDALTVNDECAITGDVDILGDFVLGEDGDGSDLILYGAVANYKAWWDQDGDTNGAFYFGADTYGIQVNLYGDVTGCGVFWDPTTDTNGTLKIGATGGSKGNDLIAYGDTNGNYLHWDQSADDLLLVGTATQLAIAGTTNATTTTTGSLRTAGGLAVLLDVFIGGGELNVANVATDIVIKANTAAALEIYDSTTKLLGIDTRNTVSGIEVITLDPGAATLPDGATSTRNGVVVKSFTSTLVGVTQVTTAFDGLSFQVEVPTIAQSGGAVAVDKASTVYIAGPPTAGASVTITAGYALEVGAGATLLGGDLIVGASGVGHEVKFHCDTASYNVWLDDDGDTNKGTWYFGDDTYGVDTVFNGQTTASRMTWDASAIQLDFLKGSIEMTGLLATQGLASPYIGIGTSAASIDVSTFGDHVLGIGTWHKLSTDGAYSLLGGYFKVETDGSNEVPNAQLVAVAPRVTVDMNLDSAYGVQSHMTISGTKTSSELINVSAYTVLGAGARTADRVCALQAMISGSGTAGTVVGDAIVGYFVNAGTVITTTDIIKSYNQSAATVVDMIEIENDGTATNGILINNDGTMGAGILFEGALDHGIMFTEDPVAGDSDNSFINIGTYAGAIAVAPTTANMFGVMQNVTLTDVNVAYWYQGYYTKITTAGTTTDTSVAGHALRMSIGSDLGAAYGIQCHTNITATNACANEIISVSALVDLGAATTTTTDRVCALQAMISGSGTAGTVSGDTFVAYIANRGTVVTTDAILNVHNQSAATAADAIRMDLNGTVTYAFNFAGTVPDAWTTATAGTSLTPSGEYVLIPVDVAGTTNPLFMVAAQTWTAA